MVLITVLTKLHYSAFNVLDLKIFLARRVFLNSSCRIKVAEAALGDNGSNCFD